MVGAARVSDPTETTTTTGGGLRKYHVLEVLGQGGFGTVYRAQLESTGGFSKPVALKVLNANFSARPKVVARLRDEARLLGLLRHRAIVQVDDLLHLDDQWSVVMEYVEGVSLAELSASVDVPATVALEVAEEVAGALFVAYEKPTRNGPPLQLLHRDIKPSNIQITPAGEVKLLDFGIARASFETRESNTNAVLMGSLPYMAPERFDFEDVHAGDVYALGITLCETILGETPQKTSLYPDRHQVHVDDLATRVRAKVPSDKLAGTLRNMLAFEPEDRPRARDIERQLRQIRRELQGPWLKDWAEAAVMPALSARELVNDSLTGEVLTIGGSVHPAAERTAEPTLAPPLTEEMEPQPRPKRRGWVRWVLALLLLLALGIGALALVGGGLVVAAGGWFWSLVVDEGVNQSLIDIEAKLAALPHDDNNLALREMLVEARTSPELDNIGLWEISLWDVDLDDALIDGVISDAEMRILERDFEQILAE